MKVYILEFEGYWRAPQINSLPADSGIYCVYTCSTHNNTGSVLRLLYIGEAENIRSRVPKHERWPDWERALQPGEDLCFSVARISLASGRKWVEAAMINRHKPPCNDEYVNSFPLSETSIRTTGKNALLETSFTVYPTV